MVGSAATLADNGSAPHTILDLLDEVMELVGHATLENSLCDTIHLCQTCQIMRTKLKRLQTLAMARRLQWFPDVTAKHEISNEGRTLTALGGSDKVEAWVAGTLLP